MHERSTVTQSVWLTVSCRAGGLQESLLRICLILGGKILRVLGSGPGGHSVKGLRLHSAHITHMRPHLCSCKICLQEGRGCAKPRAGQWGESGDLVWVCVGFVGSRLVCKLVLSRT